MPNNGKQIIDGLFFQPKGQPPRSHTRVSPAPAPIRSEQTMTIPKDAASGHQPPIAGGNNTGRLNNEDTYFINELRHLYTVARDKKRYMYERWHRNYRLINNYIGNPSPNSWAPIPRDSEIYPTISALVGWMTDQNTVIDCFPAADPYSPFYDFTSELSNDLSAVIYSTWQTENYDNEIKLVLWDAFVYGAGIFKNVWDQSLDGGYGNAKIRRVDPYNFFVDPNATSMDDMEYCVEVRRMSFNELERRFPDKADLFALSASSENLEDSRPTIGASPARPDPPNLGGINGAATQWSFPRMRRNQQGPNPLPSLVVYEYWLKQNNFPEGDYDENEQETQEATDDNTYEGNCIPQWRVVVVANGHILLDELADDLFINGQHPYERYVFDDIGEFYGISLVDHLAYPQIYINRLLTALQQNAELTGNPVFLEPTNSGLSRVGVVNRPGQRLPVSPQSMANGQGPHWIQPPPMNAQVMELVNFWISRIENTSGLSAIVRGATPTQRNSQGVISSIQEAAFVRIRAGLRNLEKTLERCAIKIGDLMVDNYTDNRIMAIVGPGGQKTSMVLHARHFYGPTKEGAAPLKFMIQIQAGASAPTSRQARTAEADTLYAMGLLDRRSALEAHQTPHIDEIMQRIESDMQKGMFNPPGARQRSGRTS